MLVRREIKLVSGFYERLSKETLINDYTARKMNEILVKKPGIYVLYKDNDIYYIGKAKDLLSRLKQHLKDKHKNKWNYFSFAILISEEYIDELESLLLSLIKPLPIGNIREENLIKRDPETEGIIKEIIQIVNRYKNSDYPIKTKGSSSKRVMGALPPENIIRLTMLRILERSEKPLKRKEIIDLTYNELKGKLKDKNKNYFNHSTWSITGLKNEGWVKALGRSQWVITEEGKKELRKDIDLINN